MNEPAASLCEFCLSSLTPSRSVTAHNGAYLMLMPDGTYIVAPLAHMGDGYQPLALQSALRELTSRAWRHAQGRFGIWGATDYSAVRGGHLVVAVVPDGLMRPA